MPHPRGCQTPPGMGTPHLPWAAWEGLENLSTREFSRFSPSVGDKSPTPPCSEPLFWVIGSEKIPPEPPFFLQAEPPQEFSRLFPFSVPISGHAPDPPVPGVWKFHPLIPKKTPGGLFGNGVRDEPSKGNRWKTLRFSSIPCFFRSLPPENRPLLLDSLGQKK